MRAGSKVCGRLALGMAACAMAAMLLAPAAHSQARTPQRPGGRAEHLPLAPARAIGRATATLTVTAFVVSSMQIAWETETDAQPLPETARQVFSSASPRRLVLVVHQSNDGSASYTLLSALRTPFRAIGNSHPNERGQNLIESALDPSDDPQEGSLGVETISLIAVPN